MTGRALPGSSGSFGRVGGAASGAARRRCCAVLRIGAASKPGLVERERRLVRVVRAAAPRPRLGPEAAHQGAAEAPPLSRGHPLLDVAGEIVDAEGPDAREVFARRGALPEALDLFLRHLAA